MSIPNQPCPPPCVPACLAGALFLLCLAGQGAAQQPATDPAPFSPDETRHGFFQFETLPSVPGDADPKPLDYYQNTPPGPQDTPPGGLFRQITTAQGFEEDLDFRRGHLYSPVRPAEVFSSDAPSVYVVFRVFTHYSSYHVIGRLFPENVPGFSGETFTDEDTAALAVEDESGYLKFFAPSQDGWHPGLYRIDIFAGFAANDLTHMGALRFTVAPRA